MTRRRRAAVLLGLALLLGTLSATHMSRREAALKAQLGPAVDVVVAQSDLPAGKTLAPDDLAVRPVPRRYAPPGAPALAGEKLAVPVRRGAPVTQELLARRPPTPPPEAALERGQRAVDVDASGSAVAGARVDVLVTTDHDSRVALEDVEVLAARPAEEDRKVTATLRVTAAQAVYLAAAQTFARDVRLLARAPGDRRKVGELTVGDGL